MDLDNKASIMFEKTSSTSGLVCNFPEVMKEHGPASHTYWKVSHAQLVEDYAETEDLIAVYSKHMFEVRFWLDAIYSNSGLGWELEGTVKRHGAVQKMEEVKYADELKQWKGFLDATENKHKMAVSREDDGYGVNEDGDSQDRDCLFRDILGWDSDYGDSEHAFNQD